ncbi:MAG: hypothetical protein ACM3ML_10600 [Micromonosporaceae bacterium]
MRSESLLRRAGEPMGPGFAPLSRFWRGADGWLRTHANYPWHRKALLDALGITVDAADAPAVGRAIAASPARELEERVFAAGGVAAAVRTRDEWLSHPQGRMVAAQPLIAGGRAGDAPPRRRGDGVRPASGVRVLDMTRVIAGPTAHWLLGEPPRSARHTAGSKQATHPHPHAHPNGNDPSWLVTVASADGPITTVSPPGGLDGQALTWPRALTGYGSDQPRW